jgi:hypothetical protein
MHLINNEHMITVYNFCKDISDSIEHIDTLDLLVAALFMTLTIVWAKKG